MPPEIQQKLLHLANTSGFRLKQDLLSFLSEVKTEEVESKGSRTGQQNKGLHLDCKLIAEKLNDAGKDMKVVLKQEVQIPWSTESVKEYIFRPIMKALFQYESTKELKKTGEIEKVHDVVMRELGEKYGIEYHEFPNNQLKALENLKSYKLAATEEKDYLEGYYQTEVEEVNFEV